MWRAVFVSYAILGFVSSAFADSYDGKWQGTSDQTRRANQICQLSMTVAVAGNKMSGTFTTSVGQGPFDTDIKPDGSFAFQVTVPNSQAGGSSVTGKFAGEKFEATGTTFCGPLTVKGQRVPS